MSNTTLAGLATALLLTTTAHAGTLTTSLVFSNGTTATAASCDVTNIGPGPISVASVQLFNVGGTQVVFNLNACPVPPATLPPHASCLAVASPFAPGGYCTATATGRFRLSLNLINASTNDTIETVAGTK